MRYDLFISYSRADDQLGEVAALQREIERSFSRFAGRALRVFRDTHADRGIRGMDDWRQVIQGSLRDSHLFLAVLSPHYITSTYCRWEWDDYVRYEAMRQCLGDGVAPVYFVTLERDGHPYSADVSDWLEAISQRQAFDLRPWQGSGERALGSTHVQKVLDDLRDSLAVRLDRSQRALASPHNLLRHNPAFVGRVQELTALRESLSRKTLGIIGTSEERSIAAVHGLGGMGKTELALAYSHAFAWDYPGGRWQVSCEGLGDLRLALSRLPSAMGFTLSAAEANDLELAFERVLREFSTRAHSLVLLDNVSEPALLNPDLLDRLAARDIDIIVTTRLAASQTPGSPHRNAFISVDELHEEDALALMASHQPSGGFADSREVEEARHIVRLLGGFTLAIETAAIWIGRSRPPSQFQIYRKRLEQDLLGASDSHAKGDTVAVRHRERLMEATLRPSLEGLKPAERRTLTLAASLPPDQVVVPWLDAFSSAPSPPTSRPMAEHAELTTLLGLRLLVDSGAGPINTRPRLVRMHRLVQEIVKKFFRNPELNSELTALVTERSLRLVHAWQDSTARWEVAPIVATARLWIKRPGTQGATIANAISKPLLELGFYVEAEALLRTALDAYTSVHGYENSVTASLMSNLGASLWGMDRAADAETTLRKALRICEDVEGPKSTSVATILNNLSAVLRSLGQLPEAERLIRRAIAIDSEIVSGSHSSAYLGSLSLVLAEMGRFEEGDAIAERAQATAEEANGDTRDTAHALAARASALIRKKDLAGAELLLERALGIEERLLGPSHPDLVDGLCNLATCVAIAGRPFEAERHYRRALRIIEEHFGSEHSDALHVLLGLGSLLTDLGRYAEAATALRRALRIGEDLFGDDHKTVAEALHALGRTLFRMGDLPEAESAIDRALRIRERRLPDGDGAIASSLNNLAMIRLTYSRVDEAESLQRRALEINRRWFGPEHDEVILTLSNLSLTLELAGRLSEAGATLKSAIETATAVEQRTGTRHPKRIPLEHRLARISRQLDRTRP